MKTEAQLRKIINAAMKEIRELEDKRRVKERLPYVGKCFKYRNGYNLNEKWWLYVKVLRLDETNLICFQFEKTSDGIIRIEPESTIHINEGYMEISCNEFRTAWIKCLQELSGLELRIESLA